MQCIQSGKLLARLSLLLAISASNPGLASEADHREFDAMLHAPFKADATASAEQPQARTFTLSFDYPFVERAQDVTWRVELLNPDGQVVQRWHGSERLFRKEVQLRLRWDGRGDGLPLADGLYQVRMQAAAHDAAGGAPAKVSASEAERVLAAADELIEQAWDISVGNGAAPAMPPFTALATGPVSAAAQGSSAGPRLQAPVIQMAAPAAAALPYTVYFANLHSQTNHSDGGGALGSCTGAQAPQSAAFGPADAYAYARNRGLDILMASEHNHMYDGSDGANTAASPATAKALYQSGLSAAADFNAANPDFLAVYGLEWGVINNGGHMNIFNVPELLEWELNSSGQLIGDTLTAKGDYAALYSLMRQRGWIGQFNHPSASGQFFVNGVPLGYTVDGDQAMALCEVLNTSAFSNNTTESETGRSSYEGACNKALEAGYHVAFSSNQDNHCANWGASSTNRTGVLIPNGTPLTQASFLEALRARRVFATMDKNAQLVLTANGYLMGSRFTNSGALNLVANYASTSGQSAATVVLYEGVPGRNGTVSQLAAAASATITPALGEHFYYAKLTQGDGKILWSAPVWVSQTTAGDVTPPAVSAAKSGTSGSITLSANASDNSGVTLVEFYIDNLLKASSTLAPYSASIDSATLSNGAHTLLAKAYDAAGNVGTSAPLSFSVSNTSSAQQLIVNGGFESGAASWTATSASLTFWLRVESRETTTTTACDTLKVQLRNSSNTVLATLATYSNLNKGTGFVQRSFDLSAWKGQTVRLYFLGVEGSTQATSFIVDDVSVTAQ